MNLAEHEPEAQQTIAGEAPSSQPWPPGVVPLHPWLTYSWLLGAMRDVEVMKRKKSRLAAEKCTDFQA